MTPATLPDYLRQTAAKFPTGLALRQPSGSNVQTWTWAEYLEAVEQISAGLRALGIGTGDHVALCSETRAEFYLADLGIMNNGSVAGALYPSYPPAELFRTIARANAKALFVEDPRMFAKLKDAPVERIILLTGEAEGAVSLAQLRQHGRHSEPLKPEDNAILYLTSGATGEPKMVMVNHGSLAANLKMAPAALPLTPDDITIAFLPSAHIAQRVAVELLPILTGSPVSFAESLLKLTSEIKTVRPTWFLAPPRMWERIYSSIRMEVQKKPALAQKAFFAALGLGLGAARYKHRGKPVPLRIALPLKLADKLIFSKIRDRFGGRLKVPVSGAAPLGRDLADFYEAIGMPLIEGFGLTEAGVVAVNPLDAPRPGSIGKALVGVEFRIADDGELLIRTPGVSSGYYNDPEATAALIRDGWLYTGDVATIDSDGYVYITGRKKEMIVASNGKKIFPSRIEALLKFEPLISQVLLAGDNLPHLVALFTVNPPLAEAVEGVKASGVAPAESPKVRAEVQKIVSLINKQLAPFEQIKRFKILPNEFSIEKGEMTATMKVRRKQVMENYAAELQELYKATAASRNTE